MTPDPALSRLVSIMARLRDPADGCPWDRAQNFATILPFTIEEAYEVAEAITRRDMPALRDELGDLLLQVVFHARMAEELGAFDIGEVIASVCDKMERRHPHIFGDGQPADWEAIKAAERGARGEDSALAGVANALPALLRADKLQRRAARVGFDWPDAAGPRAKILEELAEIDAASSDEREEEIGDLIFAVVNWARKLGIEPEAALRLACAKFERRFRTMETEAAGAFADLSLEEQEALWAWAKSLERKPLTAS